MPKYDPAKLTKVSVSLPFGIGSAEWKSDPTERKAAWSLYVELVTRVAVKHLDFNEGLLREALSSVYSLFHTTREVLKEAGPDVGASHDSVGGIAIAVLVDGISPFLTKWHPELQSWEAQRPPNISPKEHEQNWSKERKLRADLAQLRHELQLYADALAVIAGVKEPQEK